MSCGRGYIYKEKVCIAHRFFQLGHAVKESIIVIIYCDILHIAVFVFDKFKVAYDFFAHSI